MERIEDDERKLELEILQLEERIKTERRKLQLMKKKLVKKERKLRHWIGVGVIFYFVAFPLVVLLIALGFL